MDDAKILREANNIAAMPENWHSANAEDYASRFARALLAAHEQIETRDAMIKSQAECIGRLRKVVNGYRIAYGDSPLFQALPYGDMGEPTNDPR